MRTVSCPLITHPVYDFLLWFYVNSCHAFDVMMTFHLRKRLPLCKWATSHCTTWVTCWDEASDKVWKLVFECDYKSGKVNKIISLKAPFAGSKFLFVIILLCIFIIFIWDQIRMVRLEFYAINTIDMIYREGRFKYPLLRTVIYNWPTYRHPTLVSCRSAVATVCCCTHTHFPLCICCKKALAVMSRSLSSSKWVIALKNTHRKQWDSSQQISRPQKLHTKTLNPPAFLYLNNALKYTQQYLQRYIFCLHQKKRLDCKFMNICSIVATLQSVIVMSLQPYCIYITGYHSQTDAKSCICNLIVLNYGTLCNSDHDPLLWKTKLNGAC